MHHCSTCHPAGCAYRPGHAACRPEACCLIPVDSPHNLGLPGGLPVNTMCRPDSGLWRRLAEDHSGVCCLSPAHRGFMLDTVLDRRRRGEVICEACIQWHLHLTDSCYAFMRLSPATAASVFVTPSIPSDFNTFHLNIITDQLLAQLRSNSAPTLPCRI